MARGSSPRKMVICMAKSKSKPAVKHGADGRAKTVKVITHFRRPPKRR